MKRIERSSTGIELNTNIMVNSEILMGYSSDRIRIEENMGELTKGQRVVIKSAKGRSLRPQPIPGIVSSECC